MATLNVPGTYATILAAYTAAVNGDRILIAPGTHIMNSITMTVPNLTIEGSSGNPADVIIKNGAPGYAYIVVKATNFTFKNLTIDNTISTSVGGYALWFNSGTNQKILNCKVISNVAGIYISTTGYLIDRLHFHSVRALTDPSPHWAVIGVTASQGVITNSLATGYYYGGFEDTSNSGNTLIYNCTAYPAAGPTWAGPFQYGIRGKGHVYNCAVQVDHWIGGVGISYYPNAGGSFGYNVSNYVGTGVSYNYAGPKPTDFDAADVAASGLGIFRQPAVLDFHPIPNSLIDQNGDTSRTSSTDLDGVTWKNPPSRGCYEFVPSGGGGGGHKRRRKIINNMNNLNNLKL